MISRAVRSGEDIGVGSSSSLPQAAPPRTAVPMSAASSLMADTCPNRRFPEAATSADIGLDFGACTVGLLFRGVEFCASRPCMVPSDAVDMITLQTMYRNSWRYARRPGWLKWNGRDHISGNAQRPLVDCHLN